MSKESQKDIVCPNCGGKTLISEYNPKPKRSRFAHVPIKCRDCGAWCGGVTKRIKKAKEILV